MKAGRFRVRGACFHNQIHCTLYSSKDGRTDAGVHALGQVANFKIYTDMTAKKMGHNS